MTKYVALIRGIGPSNPNMRNEKLRDVFESLGFRNVQSVISSGNVLFESPSNDVGRLEATIEKAWPARLGFTATTIVRSRESLQGLVDKNPFKRMKDVPKSRLNVTFLKSPPRTELKFPHRPVNKKYQLVGLYDRAVCSVIDVTDAKTPDLMGFLEKQFGKEITTRTWKTIARILQKLDDD